MAKVKKETQTFWWLEGERKSAPAPKPAPVPAPEPVPGPVPIPNSSSRSAPKSSVRPLWRDLLALLIKVAAIVVVFALIFTFIYGFDRNTDPDMAPMVKDGDLVLFYRLSKNYSYNIGDLVVLDFQGQREIRRVVAKAGDVVDITDAGLSVNGAVQEEPNIYEPTQPYENGVTFPLTVGPGQVFVLGDARQSATDSRVYGPVNIKDTLGTVITVIRRRNI